MNAGLLSAARVGLAVSGTGRETSAFWVPGRIEVLGKHTDYAGGRSLVCASEQGFVAVAAPRADSAVRILNVAAGTEAILDLGAEVPPPAETWAAYPAAVVRRVARNFPAARVGADLAFVSNLPPASGMSSSSAFMVAVFLALADVNHLAAEAAYGREIASPEDLAGYLATVENGQSFGALTGDRGVGTFGGSEDHTAMLCCREGELSQYSFCPVRHERQVMLPTGYRFVVAVSGVKAEKTGGAKDAYNRASLRVRAILDAWHAASGRRERSLADAIAGAGAAEIRDAVERTAVDRTGASALIDRFDQFVEESVEIVPRAGDALERRDMADFGELVDRSQRLAERLLGNQIPETIMLARSARELGAVAASAFGAGFGGSVWALVPEAGIEAFSTAWEAAYRTAFPSVVPALLVTRPGPAASKV